MLLDILLSENRSKPSSSTERLVDSISKDVLFNVSRVTFLKHKHMAMGLDQGPSIFLGFGVNSKYTTLAGAKCWDVASVFWVVYKILPEILVTVQWKFN